MFSYGQVDWMFVETAASKNKQSNLEGQGNLGAMEGNDRLERAAI
jgi:hypothetical protein